MANVYGHRAKAAIVNEQGGYANILWFAPRDEFSAIETPTATPSAAGDKVTIAGDHTFATGKGFRKWLGKKHSVTTTTEPTGDDGSQSLMHKGSCIILGDDASTLEQVRDLLNDDLIILVKDQNCAADTFIQFGDECLSPTIKVSFDGKTTKEGLKEYKLDWEVKDKKFFYTGTVTEKP